MTIEILQAIVRAGDLYDGTEARATLLEALHRDLLSDPDSCWEALFNALNDLRPDPLRAVAERLLRSGAVTEDTILSEVWTTLIDVVAQQ